MIIKLNYNNKKQLLDKIVVVLFHLFFDAFFGCFQRRYLTNISYLNFLAKK